MYDGHSGQQAVKWLLKRLPLFLFMIRIIIFMTIKLLILIILIIINIIIRIIIRILLLLIIIVILIEAPGDHLCAQRFQRPGEDRSGAPVGRLSCGYPLF